MSKRNSGSLILLAIMFIIPMLAYGYLRGNSAVDYVWAAPTGHFQVVSMVSLMAGAIAVAIGIAGIRLRNVQVSFLAMAFCSLAFIFALHGLSTPGFLMPVSQVPGITAQASILLTAFWIWLSAYPADHPLVAWFSRWQGWFMLIWIGILILGVALGMLFPDAVKLLPLHLSPLKWAATVIVILLSLSAWRRYWRAYRYSQFPLQFAILCSLGWLFGAQLIIVTSQVWRASWWIYHLMLLASMGAVVIGLFRQYASDSSFVAGVQRIFTLDPGDRVEAGIAPSIRAFVIASETHDRYTAGHNYRVAVLSLRLGEALGLSPEHLRALAQGSVVHDVGKIEIPEHVLNKPGKLSAAEWALVQRHPITGFEMCKRMGFLVEELQIIKHHHERWDGSGYPDRLQGEQIPLLARVVSIADVYDAVTSDRSYRQAWSHEQAMSLIMAESGKAFDPQCVEAWSKVSRVGVQMTRYPAWLSAVSH